MLHGRVALLPPAPTEPAFLYSCTALIYSAHRGHIGVSTHAMAITTERYRVARMIMVDLCAVRLVCAEATS